jgi:hypothetical protein
MIGQDEGSFCYRFIEECLGWVRFAGRSRRSEMRREHGQRSVSGNADHVDVKSKRPGPTMQDYRKLQWLPPRTTGRFRPQ